MPSADSVQKIKSLWTLPLAPACAGYFPHIPFHALPEVLPDEAIAPPRHRPPMGALAGKTVGKIKVIALDHIENHHAFYRCRFLQHLGGCGHDKVLEARQIRSDRKHCGCRGRVDGGGEIEFEGKKQTVSAWAREMRFRGVDITERAIRNRLDRQWSIAEALLTPCQRSVGS